MAEEKSTGWVRRYGISIRLLVKVSQSADRVEGTGTYEAISSTLCLYKGVRREYEQEAERVDLISYQYQDQFEDMRWRPGLWKSVKLGFARCRRRAASRDVRRCQYHVIRSLAHLDIFHQAALYHLSIWGKVKRRWNESVRMVTLSD